MAFIVGVVLGILVWAFGRVVGLDRERAYYATILAVVASYYALFAVICSSMVALGLEVIGVIVFWAVTVIGFRISPWYAVAGLAGHGVFDACHNALISNPGMPIWWPAFCGSIDVTMAAGLALILLKTKPRQTKPSTGAR